MLVPELGFPQEDIVSVAAFGSPAVYHRRQIGQCLLCLTESMQRERIILAGSKRLFRIRPVFPHGELQTESIITHRYARDPAARSA
jgi:hypothetical protein